MKKLLPYLREYKKECIIAPLFKCLEACLDLLVPLCIASLVDDGINAGNSSYIIRIGLQLLVLAAIGLSFAIVAQWFSARAATGFAANLRSALFEHIGRFSFGTSEAFGADTLITRLTSDVNQAQTGINMALRLFLRSPFIVFGAMIMAFTVDTKAALIFAVIIPLLALVVGGIMLINMPLYKRVQARLDRVQKLTRENLAGVRVIRAFNLQDSETKRFDEENDGLTAANEHVGRFAALTNPVTYVMINLATAYLIYTGALRVESGYLTTGQVIALVNYMGQILVELIKLANVIVTETKALASCSRIEAVLAADPGMEDNAPEIGLPGDGSVVFDHVSFGYQGAGEETLTDISFAVKDGETVGIIGGTGSGKSSLVNLIPRFYDVSKGAVLVGGRNVKDYPVAELRGMIGAVLQKATLFSGTIRDNLRWGKEDATDEELTEALQAAQAADFVFAKPNGLDEMLEQGGKNLSGGQRQRLGIARALVRRPKILILDDSSSALDFATDAALRRAIRNLPFRPTTFLVSQRAATVMHADRILVLNDGILTDCGTHEELMERCSVYREIYRSQFKEEEETRNG